MQDIYDQLLTNLAQTTLLEFVAVVFGIASVYFSKRENILVFPSGLVNTIIYVYLSLKGELFGEASVNLYYTVMSIYGWWLWSRRDEKNRPEIRITRSSSREWKLQLVFFGSFYVVIWSCLQLLNKHFALATLPVADAFASATAFTGMWLMARKKVESWYWWIATNIASIPLYFVKGYVFTSFYYIILLVLAVSGLFDWIKRSKQTRDERTLQAAG